MMNVESAERKKRQSAQKSTNGAATAVRRTVAVDSFEQLVLKIVFV
jgi:hypothetical protein